MRFRYLLLLIAILGAAPKPGAQSRPNEYVVRSGDTLFRIASEHGLSVSELRRLNSLTGDLIMVGQRLRLSTLVPLPPRPIVGADGQLVPTVPPQADRLPPVVRPPPAATGEITGPEIPSANVPRPAVEPPAGDTQRVHIVQPGETLFAIALRYDTTVEAIRGLNRIEGDRIEVGQRLSVAGSALSQVVGSVRLPPYSLTNTTVPADLVHFVEPGETLYSIAARLRLTTAELLAGNNLTTTALEPGTVLYMPRQIDLRVLAEANSLPQADTTGLALVYPEGTQNRRLAGGITYDSDRFIAGHRTIPLGTVVLVTNPASERSVFVQIMDRGPASQSYLIELSEAAAEALELDPNSARRVELRMLP